MRGGDSEGLDSGWVVWSQRGSVRPGNSEPGWGLGGGGTGNDRESWSHLILCQEVPHCVQQFVEHFKPRQVAAEGGHSFRAVPVGRGPSPGPDPHIPHLRMQRQLWAPARRREKPNLRVPVRSVRAKVKCCTAVLGGSLGAGKALRDLGIPPP